MSGFDLAERLSRREEPSVSEAPQLAGGSWQADGAVTVNSLHPSTYMPTKMVLQEIGHSIDSIEDGVAATARLVNDASLAGVTGRFYDRTREARANAQAYDPDARARLWELSLQLTKG
jgi:hypothetical protein